MIFLEFGFDPNQAVPYPGGEWKALVKDGVKPVFRGGS